MWITSMFQCPTESFNTQVWGMEIRFQADITKQSCFLCRSASFDKESSRQTALERWLLIPTTESVIRISTHINMCYYGKWNLDMEDVIINKTCLLMAQLLGSALSGWAVGQEMLFLDGQRDRKCSFWMGSGTRRALSGWAVEQEVLSGWAVVIGRCALLLCSLELNFPVSLVQCFADTLLICYLCFSPHGVPGFTCIILDSDTLL